LRDELWAGPKKQLVGSVIINIECFLSKPLTAISQPISAAYKEIGTKKYLCLNMPSYRLQTIHALRREVLTGQITAVQKMYQKTPDCPKMHFWKLKILFSKKT
jgi:hypothetical protein